MTTKSRVTALSPGQVSRLWDVVEQTSRELVWEVGPDGALRYLTDAAPEILGRPASDLIGRSAFELMHIDDVGRAGDLFAVSVETKTGWSQLKLRVVRPDGEIVWVETSGIPHLDAAGSLVAFTATTRRLDADEVREVERERVRDRITEVLRDRCVRTLWQPIFSLADGRVVGAEALSRFPRGPQQTPDKWFTQAAEVGLAVELEVLAIEAALSAAATIPDGIYLSLNASPAVVASGRVLIALERSGVRPDRVVLELTEHVSVDDYSGLVAPLHDLRSRGVRLAVDDAGAGFASFRHILRLAPDIIKLDQSIVQGITDNPAQRALATAMVLFAIEVGPIEVIAEGVETGGDLSTVSSLGLDAAQGHFVSRPRDMAELDWERVIDLTGAAPAAVGDAAPLLDWFPAASGARRRRRGHRWRRRAREDRGRREPDRAPTSDDPDIAPPRPA